MEIESLSLSHFSFLVLFFYPFFFFFFSNKWSVSFPFFFLYGYFFVMKRWRELWGKLFFFFLLPEKNEEKKRVLDKNRTSIIQRRLITQMIDYLNKCLIILKFWLIFSCFVTIIEKFGDQLSKNCFSINLNNRYIRENV